MVEIPGAAAMLTETEIGGFQDTGTLADRPLESQPASTISQQVSRFLTLFPSREGKVAAVVRLTQTSINFFLTGVFLARKLKLIVHLQMRRCLVVDDSSISKIIFKMVSVVRRMRKLRAVRSPIFDCEPCSSANNCSTEGTVSPRRNPSRRELQLTHPTVARYKIRARSSSITTRGDKNSYGLCSRHS